MRVRTVNGWPSLVVSRGDVLRSVIQIHTDGERIDAIDTVANPEKLARLAAELGLRVRAARGEVPPGGSV